MKNEYFSDIQYNMFVYEGVKTQNTMLLFVFRLVVIHYETDSIN